MAVVDNAEREVVVEFGVPLSRVSFGLHPQLDWGLKCTHGASVGVSGLDGGSGMPMRVGVAMLSWFGKLESLKVIFFQCGVLAKVVARYIEVDIFARLGYYREIGLFQEDLCQFFCWPPWHLELRRVFVSREYVNMLSKNRLYSCLMETLKVFSPESEPFFQVAMTYRAELNH
jgi:hypothetical protein